MTSNLATDLLTRAAGPEAAVPPFEELVSLVKPTLSEYFKPALLARMTVVPYVPIRPEALEGIIRTKLGAVAARMAESHRAELVFDDAVVAAIAARCREVESGARNVDHILGGLADGRPATSVRLAIGPGGAFECSGAA
jgi:type VI secretion system protein VasG